MFLTKILSNNSEKAASDAGKFPESIFERIGLFFFDFTANGDREINKFI